MTLNSADQNLILLFYSELSVDDRGRKINEIWQWNYAKLEYTHDYIQWLFPLIDQSRFNRDAPTLTSEVIQTFRTSKELKRNLLKSLLLMLEFYGLKLVYNSSNQIEIVKNDNYSERKKQWINLRNHNYLRLTRILTSLKLLGLENYSQALFNCLSQMYQEEQSAIGLETYNYWKNA